jgi:hypothetical protein
MREATAAETRNATAVPRMRLADAVRLRCSVVDLVGDSDQLLCDMQDAALEVDLVPGDGRSFASPQSPEDDDVPAGE